MDTSLSTQHASKKVMMFIYFFLPFACTSSKSDLSSCSTQGIARYSPLFYGYYGNAEVIGQGYRLPLAYMVTTLLAFAYSFIAVLQK